MSDYIRYLQCVDHFSFREAIAEFLTQRLHAKQRLSADDVGPLTKTLHEAVSDSFLLQYNYKTMQSVPSVVHNQSVHVPGVVHNHSVPSVVYNQSVPSMVHN